MYTAVKPATICRITAWGGRRGKQMSAARHAMKKQVADRGSQMQSFLWEGTDKRGVKMKGEQSARNVNMLRAELRRQGIMPSSVKAKPKPLFGAAGKNYAKGYCVLQPPDGHDDEVGCPNCWLIRDYWRRT